MTLRYLILFSFFLAACNEPPIPCASLEVENAFIGSEMRLIDCSESDQTRVEWNKTDGRTNWQTVNAEASHTYQKAGRYFIEVDFIKNEKSRRMTLTVEVTAPTKESIQGEWKLWRYEDRAFTSYPGIAAANPFESILEDTYEVEASWNIGDTSIVPDPDFSFCLLCFGAENYSYFEEDGELSVGSLLTNIAYFSEDSMVLDAGYGGDPFLIYMSKL